jgi:hypothetical protein
MVQPGAEQGAMEESVVGDGTEECVSVDGMEEGVAEGGTENGTEDGVEESVAGVRMKETVVEDGMEEGGVEDGMLEGVAEGGLEESVAKEEAVPVAARKEPVGLMEATTGRGRKLPGPVECIDLSSDEEVQTKEAEPSIPTATRGERAGRRKRTWGERSSTKGRPASRAEEGKTMVWRLSDSDSSDSVTVTEDLKTKIEKLLEPDESEDSSYEGQIEDNEMDVKVDSTKDETEASTKEATEGRAEDYPERSAEDRSEGSVKKKTERSFEKSIKKVAEAKTERRTEEKTGVSTKENTPGGAEDATEGSAKTKKEANVLVTLPAAPKSAFEFFRLMMTARIRQRLPGPTGQQRLEELPRKWAAQPDSTRAVFQAMADRDVEQFKSK